MCVYSCMYDIIYVPELKKIMYMACKHKKTICHATKQCPSRHNVIDVHKMKQLMKYGIMHSGDADIDKRNNAYKNKIIHIWYRHFMLQKRDYVEMIRTETKSGAYDKGRNEILYIWKGTSQRERLNIKASSLYHKRQKRHTAEKRKDRHQSKSCPRI